MVVIDTLGKKQQPRFKKTLVSFAIPGVVGWLHFPPGMARFHLWRWRGTHRSPGGFAVQTAGIMGVFGAYRAEPENAGRRRKQTLPQAESTGFRTWGLWLMNRAPEDTCRSRKSDANDL